VALAALLLPAGAAQAQTAATSLPRCTEATAEMLSKVDSATSIAGDTFSFKITEHVKATETTPEIGAGTRGYGIVSFADHAHGSGTPGRLALEPRYLRLADGAHVQVLADPQLAENFAEGKTRNLNGALGFVPGLGLAVGGYNALHRGKEVAIEKGTPFSVLIGDALASGECFVPAPSDLNVR
jgi:hypothetical protein